MPDFTDVYTAAELTVLGSNDIVWGTAVIGTTYGVVKSCTVNRNGTVTEIPAGNGNLKAVVMSNMKYEATFETVFSTGITAPGPMEQIELPEAEVTGRIVSVEVAWERGAERGLNITATSWDALEAATAYKLNTGTGTYTSLDA